mmetsp:Transcript_20607/g.18756  ORF Transcript_20607/g.18756 Transcript_20607/m.18756 type:complete len:108 (-) Transcript_20607:598-921(-)
MNNINLDIVGDMIPHLGIILNLLKVPYRNSRLSGQLYFEELMSSENDQRFIDCCRMRKQTFLMFVNILEQYSNLKSTKNISSGEQLMILLYVLQGHTVRNTAERFHY